MVRRIPKEDSGSPVAGMAVLSEVREREQEEIADAMRHVDGTEAIVSLARRAEAAGISSG